MAPMSIRGRSRQIMADHGRSWYVLETGANRAHSPFTHGSMITEPRHRELLQRAIDAQTVVADELQSAFKARMALPVGHPQRLETRDLWRDISALEALISGAYDLLDGKGGAVTLQGRSQQ